MDKIDYAVNKTNLYEQIAGSLEQAIMRSEFKLTKLPSEQELSRRFQVSRTVIREALKVLKERGLIQSRNGEGSYISRPNADTISSAVNRIVQMDNISNDKLHNMRLILETAGARLAAVNASPEEVAHLEYIMDQMSNRGLPQDQRIRLDAEFHVVTARASGNELLGIFVDIMTVLLKEYMSKGFFGNNRIKNTIAQHMKVLEGIKNHNPDEAEIALYDHLVAARNDVGKYEGIDDSAKSTARKLVSTACKRR
ncbi:GntR family transcriptional regulator [Spirochaetia bacterium]|nr:GntR family transcriptional regulator [Spirochaetia bacterium]